MNIYYIKFEDEYISYFEKDNPTGIFRGYMNFIIENYFNEIMENDEMKKWFSTNPNDPLFKTASVKGGVSEYNGLYYSTYSGTPDKIAVIYHIANILEKQAYVCTYLGG